MTELSVLDRLQFEAGLQFEAAQAEAGGRNRLPIEVRGLIEPKDINAVEFECRNCGARMVIALNKLHTVPTACSRCEKAWFLHSSPEHGRLHNFMLWLREYAEATDQPYLMRFEVKGLTDAKK